MMTKALERHEFASGEDLAEALAGAVAQRLAAAVEARGAALLAVSGGTTPVLFFEALSRREIDWQNVTITLIDERFVPVSSERSNARLLERHLLRGRAGKARFVGLFHETATVGEAARIASDEIAALNLPLDAAVLGMGTDGHTASFFPDADGLGDLLSPEEKGHVLPVHAASAGEPRLTLALPVIASAHFVALHIEGEQKRAVLEQALASVHDPLPVKVVIDNCAVPVWLYWAPDREAAVS